jgi:predicted TIM-barrel fold metal-dependent hydrolase
MDGKIAVEEHFAIDETLADSRGVFPGDLWAEGKDRLTDLHGRRIGLMDQVGIAMMLLSLNAPAVQAIPDAKAAGRMASLANDRLAEQVAKRPDRFQALAALPMQDPELAAAELERCVRQLGFKGALVNGFSQVGDAETIVYYDTEPFRPFWSVVERLDVPFYLHPRSPLPRHAEIYAGHPWLMGPSWGFGQETAVHALRLMGSGLFDAFPKLAIVLGHMGEGLPFSMWRVDHCNAWMPARQRYPAKRKIHEYFQENFYVTTSGNFRSQALINTILEIGSDRIMFSADWPFENLDHATQWFDAAPIAADDRRKIGRDNARRVFKLG